MIDDVVIGMDPAIDDVRRQRVKRDIARFAGIVAAMGHRAVLTWPSDRSPVTRRARIRAAARARKARRGWR